MRLKATNSTGRSVASLVWAALFFGVPLLVGCGIAALAAAHQSGMPYLRFAYVPQPVMGKSPTELRAAVPRPGLDMLYLHTERTRNVELHRAAQAAVARALEGEA